MDKNFSVRYLKKSNSSSIYIRISFYEERKVDILEKNFCSLINFKNTQDEYIIKDTIQLLKLRIQEDNQLKALMITHNIKESEIYEQIPKARKYMMTTLKKAGLI
jgi:hypothetical protein